MQLSTPRLTLRAHTIDDLDEFHALFSDADVVRYLYEEPLTREEAHEHLARRLRDELPSADGEWLNLAIVLDGRCVGSAGVQLVSRQHRQCEIGYLLAPDAQGRGLATEAATAMVTLAFDELHAHRVVGRLDARNAASARLLERLGMRREAHLIQNEWVKGEWTDELVYAITEDEWRARAR